MDKPIKKIMHEGKVYYSVQDAARYLGTTKTKIRERLGSGELTLGQANVNGKLLVSAESLVAYKYHPPEKAPGK